ncbi:hypothetical protein LAA31_002468 [Salmonella enterica subsp. enterica serovar Enteritidis]|nr:hypothetical protein [Salmonella enterica subsp. enterica serovar Enteritidis]EIC3584644.1 hypothetical protein [Salmonella enterica subsp. enterica serovar Enteritidis]
MAKIYIVEKRAGNVLSYYEEGKPEKVKTLKLEGFDVKSLRKGVKITFKGLIRAGNLHIIKTDGTMVALAPATAAKTTAGRGCYGSSRKI